MAGLIPFNKRRNDLMGVGFDEFQNMIDDFFSETWPTRRSLVSDTFKIDVQDSDQAYLVEAEIPGVQKEEIILALDDGKLNISVKKEENKEESSKNYIHRERRICSMSRNIFLKDAASEGVKAKLEDGILKIEIPKRMTPETSKMITIE